MVGRIESAIATIQAEDAPRWIGDKEADFDATLHVGQQMTSAVLNERANPADLLPDGFPVWRSCG